MRAELDNLVATAQAAIRLTQRIVTALDDYTQGEAEAKWESVLRKDTQLSVNFQTGTMTLHVADEPLFTCPAVELYAEILAALADDVAAEHDFRESTGLARGAGSPARMP
jgi:hypothetical protein